MTIYTIIKTGYEGIDELCYSSVILEDAIQKISELKNVCLEKKKIYDDYLVEHNLTNEDEIDDHMFELMKMDSTIYTELTDFEDPDFYCLMEFKNDKYSCVTTVH
jgi:hypothetical protein